MMVTTGGRATASALESTSFAVSTLSASASVARTARWPSSSTTSTAVSWSSTWLMVAITPILNSVLTTSAPFSASFCARSPTVMPSPIAISRTTGAVGREKPPWPWWPECRCSTRGFGRFGARRRPWPSARCSSPRT